MASILWPMAMAITIAALTSGSRNGACAEISQFDNPLEQRRSLLLQLG
jgi:hypothetical protein